MTKSAHGSPWQISSAMAPRHFLRQLFDGPALQGLEENEPEESWLGECFEDQTWAKWVNFQGRSNDVECIYIHNLCQQG